MICNKCNQSLPDDSEFCQYCGSHIEKTVTTPTEEAITEKETVTVCQAPVESTVVATPVEVIPKQLPAETTQLLDFGKMAPGEAMNAIMQIQAKNTVEAMKANRKTQPDNEGDADFGLVPEKPIFTLAIKSVDGEEEYLDNLYTINGEKISYNRRGSISANGINGMIDIYDTYLPSGQLYETIYINMYGAKRSERAPSGFSFDANKKPVCPKCKRELPNDSEFCQFCGNRIHDRTAEPMGAASSAPITNPVRKAVRGIPCTENKAEPSKERPKKKGKVFTIILAVAVMLSLVVNIVQCFYIGNIQTQLDAANQTISNLEAKGKYFDEIVSEMRYGNAGYAASNFFASDSVIVVSKNSTASFTLTANWSYGGTVEVDYSSSAAWVSFDNTSWSYYTTMTVHPRYKGVTVATFSNNVDYSTFKVLIIVTD